jgi:predicted Zn finger-like uncharacterized protein
MKLPAWLTARYRRKSLSPTRCPECGAEMILVDRSTMSGDDMRTYRCGRCRKDHIVDFGIATWKVLSDARNSNSEN